VGRGAESSAPDPTNSVANGQANRSACQADCKGASVYFTHSPNRDHCYGTEDQANNGNGYRVKAACLLVLVAGRFDNRFALLTVFLVQFPLEIADVFLRVRAHGLRGLCVLPALRFSAQIARDLESWRLARAPRGTNQSDQPARAAVADALHPYKQRRVVTHLQDVQG